MVLVDASVLLDVLTNGPEWREWSEGRLVASVEEEDLVDLLSPSQAPGARVNRIRLLSEQVANQIAAGEVVERPASVVKELIENSLDAGATRIAVEILAAGRSLIRVTDDGAGMSRDDALLCLERHATSKIASAADLGRITTMGFRGEAVPSIASVSRFTLTTRERDSPADAPATRVVLNGGKILEVREAGAPAGTSVEVRSLFFNVPARRKFLRSDDTERAHIEHGLTTAALAHPHVGFTLVLEGRTAWQYPALPPADTPAGQLRTLQERLRLLVGPGVSWVPLDSAGRLEAARVPPEAIEAPADVSPPAEIRIWGWIGAPGVSRGTRDDQHLFVNRRPVENRGLNAALIEGYHNALMKGRYPLCCVFLELDPAEVDVNIHPAKREVKFHRERAVRRFVADAVREALKAWHQPVEPRVEGGELVEGRGETAAQGRKPLASAAAHAPSPDAARGAVLPEAGRSAPRSPVPVQSDLPATPSAPAPPHQVPAPAERLAPRATNFEPPPTPNAPRFPSPGLKTPHPALPTLDSSAAPPALLSIPLRLIGVIGRLYVVFESDRGVVLLDQHAAHERVLYEEMLRRGQQGASAPSQRLLLPETLELAPKDAAFLRENLDALTRLGVGLAEFGERTFLLDALPPFVKSTDPRRFALELVDELRAAGASVNAWRLGEAVVAKTVCRHAVKANDPLAGPELENLIDDLRRCDMPYTCPHGRPTLIEMSYRDLEKKFGRIAE